MKPPPHRRRSRGQALAEYVLILFISMGIVLALSQVGFSNMKKVYERQRDIARQIFIF